jgi:hypothetical protein
MKAARILLTTVFSLTAVSATLANTYGSVEPIANPDVVDTTAIRKQKLSVRKAFADRLLACGIVDRVIDALATTGSISTINRLNTHFEVGAGGFAGETNPSYVFTVIDDGPNAASKRDIKILTNSLGYVLSQGSAFLLDSSNPNAFDFPANYVVLNFPTPPTLERSAALFEAVGGIDSALFETDTSGYTQYGRAYLSLQSDVPDQQFIDGYVDATELPEFADVEYTPVNGGTPALFQGGASFPGNGWKANPGGEKYLSRIPAASHEALAKIRTYHLRVTRAVVKAGGKAAPSCR